MKCSCYLQLLPFPDFCKLLLWFGSLRQSTLAPGGGADRGNSIDSWLENMLPTSSLSTVDLHAIDTRWYEHIRL
jgi:hypothetical protein